MSPEQARALFLDQCQPGDRGALERHGSVPAVAAIMTVTAFIEAEARGYAGHYTPHSDGWNTFILFADMVSDLTSEHFEQSVEVRRDPADQDWDNCPRCKTGSLDTGFECNACGFDALPLVHLRDACEQRGDRVHPSGLYAGEIDSPIRVPARSTGDIA